MLQLPGSVSALSRENYGFFRHFQTKSGYKMTENLSSYVYKWTHLPSMMWYVGSRTAKGCNKGLSGFKHSEESKRAISLARKGKTWDVQTKEKISLSEKRTKLSKKLNNIKTTKGESIC